MEERAEEQRDKSESNHPPARVASRAGSQTLAPPTSGPNSMEEATSQGQAETSPAHS